MKFKLFKTFFLILITIVFINLIAIKFCRKDEIKIAPMFSFDLTHKEKLEVYNDSLPMYFDFAINGLKENKDTLLLDSLFFNYIYSCDYIKKELLHRQKIYINFYQRKNGITEKFDYGEYGDGDPEDSKYKPSRLVNSQWENGLLRTYTFWNNGEVFFDTLFRNPIDKLGIFKN